MRYEKWFALLLVLNKIFKRIKRTAFKKYITSNFDFFIEKYLFTMFSWNDQSEKMRFLLILYWNIYLNKHPITVYWEYMRDTVTDLYFSTCKIIFCKYLEICITSHCKLQIRIRDNHKIRFRYGSLRGENHTWLIFARRVASRFPRGKISAGI